MPLRIANIFKATYDLWTVFKSDLERNVRGEGLDMSTMHKIAEESHVLDGQLLQARLFS